MKLNQVLTAFIAVTLTTSPLAMAEVKPNGTILETFCGENEAPARERNRAITEVCLAVVQGSGVELVVIKSEDAKGRPMAKQTLPIFTRTNKRQINSASREVMLNLVSSQTAMKGHYEMLRTAKATLTIDTGRRPVLTREMPKSLSGVDLNGTSFEVNELTPVVHTASLDIH